jgi:hypothetical protein
MAGLKFLVVDKNGHQRTLSEGVYVGPSQPTSSDILLWVDTSTTPATLRYREDDTYKPFGSQGSTEVSSLANLPTDYKLVIANISGDQSLSVGDMYPGQEIHVIVKGSGSITVPSDDVYVNLTDDLITVDDYAEINIVSDGTKKYIRAI